jgi:peptidoglycan/xylan/chitin deacetylase (PgdA/CDA1 family)
MSPRVFLAESGLPRRPRFWLSAAIAATRVTSPLGAPRVLARKILTEAAESMAGPRIGARSIPLDGPLPILMYHRIAKDGPAALARYRTSPASFAAQMKYLRDKGYRTITSVDLVPRRQRSIGGRPILITFDDGYRDFHEIAWPILRAENFTAEVMVVTDLVGRTAEWDAAFGPAAPLMDWPQIRALGTASVRFGSHVTSHRHMADLSVGEIVDELARSRAALEENLGRPCLSIAAPFGEAEPGFTRLAARHGYIVGFGTQPGEARPGHDLLHLPRIEVWGDWTVERLAQALDAQAG